MKSMNKEKTRYAIHLNNFRFGDDDLRYFLGCTFDGDTGRTTYDVDHIHEDCVPRDLHRAFENNKHNFIFETLSEARHVADHMGQIIFALNNAMPRICDVEIMEVPYTV